MSQTARARRRKPLERVPASVSFRDFPWRLTYRASFTEPTDLLHEFYLPALARAVRYDRMAGYFRPSSLASASQGCTAFIGRDCRIRLAVAAELDSDDMSTSLGGYGPAMRIVDPPPGR